MPILKFLLRKLSPLWKYLKAILWAVFFVLLLRAYIFKAYKIPSESMANTLLVGDQLFVNRLAYGFDLPFTQARLFSSDPEFGDIIVFTDPLDEGSDFWKQKDFIKRVVGTPGDQIRIENKRLFINDRLVAIPEEIHLDPKILGGVESPRDNFGPITVPPDFYFVMGDNRDFSHDSRFWGFVPMKLVVGKAGIFFWSWDSENKGVRWSRIGRPVHGDG